MTADLKEAFDLAAVISLGWRRCNEEQEKWGWIDIETGQRLYRPEPTVEFFRRSYSLTEICGLAAVLAGPLSPHMRAVFDLIDDGVGEPTPETYGEAVEALITAIEVEHERPKLSPLGDSPLADQIRDKAFCDGVAAAVAAALESGSGKGGAA